jgi:glutamate-1-semialdehyde aminotransferase
MSVAVRIARAATGKQVVLVAGYHGWHDWYLAANLDRPEALDRLLLPRVSTAGVPRALRGTSIAFDISDRAGFDAAMAEAGDDLAAVVLEPARYEQLSDGDAAYLREATDRSGGVLIFDEITSGFRLDLGGAHRSMRTQPDLCVFAKGMSNGYPMAAVIGRRSVMEAAGRAFVSSTSWTDRIGPTAALATIAKFERVAAEERADAQPGGVAQHLAAMGDRMRAGWRRLADTHGLALATRGIAPLPSFSFGYDDAPALHTLYTQEMLDRGFLASGAFYASYAHQPAHVDAALEATGAAFEVLARALDAGDVLGRLRGPVAHRGLRGAPPKETR